MRSIFVGGTRKDKLLKRFTDTFIKIFSVFGSDSYLKSRTYKKIKKLCKSGNWNI